MAMKSKLCVMHTDSIYHQPPVLILLPSTFSLRAMHIMSQNIIMHSWPPMGPKFDQPSVLTVVLLVPSLEVHDSGIDDAYLILKDSKAAMRTLTTRKL